jgi:hypothetical protein
MTWCPAYISNSQKVSTDFTQTGLTQQVGPYHVQPIAETDYKIRRKAPRVYFSNTFVYKNTRFVLFSVLIPGIFYFYAHTQEKFPTSY